MKKALTYISLVLFLGLQTSVGRYIKIFGIVPSIALVFTILYAMTNQASKSAALGLFCGLLFDSCRPGSFGLCALLVMYTSLLASFMSKSFYYENKTSAVLGVFIYTVIYKSVFLIFTSVMYSQAPFFYTFFRYILLEAALSSVIAVPVLFYVKWLNNEYIRGI